MRIYHARALDELAKTQPEAAAIARQALEQSVKTERWGTRLTATQKAKLKADVAASGMNETDYFVYKMELGA
jgi:predicted transcriptional regulator